MFSVVSAHCSAFWDTSRFNDNNIKGRTVVMNKQAALGVAALVLSAMVMSASAKAGEFKLTSGEFADGDYLANEQVFAGFGCEGKNLSPSLSWSGAPAGTKSLAPDCL